MNASICSAGVTTHSKIVTTAMAVAIAVVWIGIAARALVRHDRRQGCSTGQFFGIARRHNRKQRP